MRTALGASRLRLVRQLLAESLCLAGVGGLLGVLAADIAIGMLTHLNPGNIPRMEETSIDWRVLLFALCASVARDLMRIVSGVVRLAVQFKRGTEKLGRPHGEGGAGRLQHGLTIAEVALTFVLLAGSGLLIRSFLKLQSVDKGFVPSSTVTMNIHLDARYNQPERQNAFFRGLIDKTSALPAWKQSRPSIICRSAAASLSPCWWWRGTHSIKRPFLKIAQSRLATLPPWVYRCSAAKSSPATM